MLRFQIHVDSRYLEDRSLPEEDKYVFAYTITIRNLDTKAAKLLNRYWLITDGNGKTTEVAGAGVVGQQPTIQPGGQYSYTSGAVLETPVGTMEGHYEMEEESGAKSKTPIPVFRLAVPKVLN
ncbi:Co2+/Mg2+ efflux protein ApaG [Gallaecimonas kandeliae]|uniref:Co2+/Mg2+ efflux protein ApaG n=1 Tax=Gallaecimonas kandeliae TaxID=3029055 RepID=UPI002647AB62|nr:Co2+/Mg2+ efflux protein ApaG [Gallaecimonas kandeliae]WKE66139.1 Co2+/Mg2+ efflux protein ApaG [Gallaecimonas kandeliae]